jgi:hypothetical protein
VEAEAEWGSSEHFGLWPPIAGWRSGSVTRAVPDVKNLDHFTCNAVRENIGQQRMGKLSRALLAAFAASIRELLQRTD